MLEGPALVADIKACTVARGQCAFWWLGQHSFVVKLGRTVVYADPFLSPLPGRRVPPPLAPGDITNADLVLGSHDHADHIDRDAWPALAAASPRALFVVPERVLRRGLAADTGIAAERFAGMNDGDCIRAAGLTIRALASAHEFLDRDAATGLYEHLGFVVRGNGCAWYHSGDTCLYDGLSARLRRLRPDVMFLPINGRDARRLRAGVIGNMTYQEAGDLAGGVRPAVAVPTHFDMFDGNTEDPQRFADYLAVKYPGVRALVPEHGRREVVVVERSVTADGR
ncbi:MAG: putative L-ascorbate-6-phosphate lactonase UlaG [Lentisphaerae bacterium ADurb.BinA184]|nr:MAG: putative L-ascorbate-6-phosphate lactonase UlaG [Lentisphaerae bacterium ADurb.BinA184]